MKPYWGEICRTLSNMQQWIQDHPEWATEVGTNLGGFISSRSQLQYLTTANIPLTVTCAQLQKKPHFAELLLLHATTRPAEWDLRALSRTAEMQAWFDRPAKCMWLLERHFPSVLSKLVLSFER